MSKHFVSGLMAIVSLLGFLAVVGLLMVRTIPPGNADFFNLALMALCGFVGTAFGFFLGSSLGSARKTELQAMGTAGNAPPTDGQAGHVKITALTGLALLCIVAVVAVLAFGGCAPQQSATQQIMQQTKDPATISLAAYADGLQAYVEAQNLYMPYQAIIEKSRPQLAVKILGYFAQARGALNDWKMLGSLSPAGEQSFRQALRQITIELAMYAEKKE